jgi:ParB family transcriptional regulator, chromosome partitioning protein
VDNPRLGKGLGALFGNTAAQAQATSERTTIAESVGSTGPLMVSVENIETNPRQPRQNFADEALYSLSRSILDHGIIQPLIVILRPSSGEDGPRYQLIAGERRLRAAKLAGIRTVPVVVKNANPQQMLEMALIENIQREDLNPIETAEAYQMLIDEYNLTQDEVASRVGKDRSTISNALRLLLLPPEVQEKLKEGSETFTAGHAKALTGLATPEQQIDMMKKIIAQELTVRQAEELVRALKDAALRLVPDRKGTRHGDPDVLNLEEEFMRSISLKVTLKRSNKGTGTLTIAFNNEDELNLLYELLVMRGQQNEEF